MYNKWKFGICLNYTFGVIRWIDLWHSDFCMAKNYFRTRMQVSMKNLIGGIPPLYNINENESKKEK